MAVDGFLELFGSDGKAIPGESTDAAFSQKIAIRSFTLGSSGTLGGSDKDEEGDKGAASEALESAREQWDQARKFRAMAKTAQTPKERKELLKAADDAEKAAKVSEKAAKSASTPTPPPTPPPAPVDKTPRKFSLSFKVTKDVDSSSTTIFQAYCRKAQVQEAKLFQSAKVSLRKAHGKSQLIFLILEFTNLYVSSYSVEASDDDKLPRETVGFTFDSITLRYSPQVWTNEGSETITGWDFTTNKPK